MRKDYRIDFSFISKKVSRTPNGYLIIPCRATRIGIMEYLDADGKVRRELKPAEELFKMETLESMQCIPVTDQHPAEIFVTPETYKKLAVGYAPHYPYIDEGYFLSTNIVVTDQSMIDKILNKMSKEESQEVSCGYSAEVEETKGKWNGIVYDAIQRDITFNHIALVDVGRAGEEVKLNLDSETSEKSCNDTKHKNKTRKLTAFKSKLVVDSSNYIIKGENKMDKDFKTITLKNGDTYKVPKAVADAMEEIEKEDNEAEAENKKKDKLKKKKKKNAEEEEEKEDFATSDPDLEEARDDEEEDDDDDDDEEGEKKKDKKKKKMNNSARIILDLKRRLSSLEKQNRSDKRKSIVDAEVEERVNLLDVSRRVLGEEKTDALKKQSSIDLKKVIIKALKQDSETLEGKNESYINSYFDIVTKDLNDSTSSMANAFEKAGKSMNQHYSDNKSDSKKETKLNAREKSLERKSNAWKQDYDQQPKADKEA